MQVTLTFNPGDHNRPAQARANRLGRIREAAIKVKRRTRGTNEMLAEDDRLGASMSPDGVHSYIVGVDPGFDSIGIERRPELEVIPGFVARLGDTRGPYGASVERRVSL